MTSSYKYKLKELYSNIEKDISNLQISQKLREEQFLFSNYFYYKKGKYEQIVLQFKNNMFSIIKYKKENYFRIRCDILIKNEIFLNRFKQYRFINIYNNGNPSNYINKYIKTDDESIINEIINFYKIIND